VNKNNLILETFLRLTSRTYPHGTEDELVESMIEQGIFPVDLQKDVHGNYFYKIGESRTIFASHLDTVSKESTTVTHTFDDYMNYMFEDYTHQSNLIFPPGSQIIVEKERCLFYSRSFWKKLMDSVICNEIGMNGGRETHIVERSIQIIFENKYKEKK